MRSGILLVVSSLIATAHSFHEPTVILGNGYLQLVSITKTTSIDITSLWGVPAPKRTARRHLRKRRRRNEPTDDSTSVVDTRDADADDKVKLYETRPLIKSYAREQGADYWIDEQDLENYAKSLRRMPREAGQVTDEKLWKEVLRPYRENWIGLFSVLIVVIATVVTNFPELLQAPLIEIPDL